MSTDDGPETLEEFVESLPPLTAEQQARVAGALSRIRADFEPRDVGLCTEDEREVLARAAASPTVRRTRKYRADPEPEADLTDVQARLNAAPALLDSLTRSNALADDGLIRRPMRQRREVRDTAAGEDFVESIPPLTAEQQRPLLAEREVDAHLAASEVTDFEDASAFLQHLDALDAEIDGDD